MPNCDNIKPNPSQVCIGDLRNLITLYIRSIVDPSGGSVDFNEDFSSPTQVWAMVKTLSKGVEIFDGTNIIGQATHLFYIRYRQNITFEKFLDYNSRRFRILDVQNIDERNEIIVLKCTERGDSTLPVTWS